MSDEIEELADDTVIEPIQAHNTPRTLGMLTDIGRKRKVDEDSILATKISVATESKNRKFTLLMVADGMGGPGNGEKASKLALNAIARTVIPYLIDGKHPTDALEDGIATANRDILAHIDEHPEHDGMGTTAVCAIVESGYAHIANIGDSRAYVVDGRNIKRITKDHSYVQAMVDAGEITDEEARTHPSGNQITKAIGPTPSEKPDLFKIRLAPDESLLLCCGGVMAHLTDGDIHDLVAGFDPQVACQRIVDTANERGGSDNISLIILSSGSDDSIHVTDEMTVMDLG